MGKSKLTNYIMLPGTNTLIHVDPKRNLSGNALIAYKATLKLNDDQKQVLIGSLLGDGYFSFSRSVKRPVYFFCFAQAIKNADYVDHMYQLFKPLVGTPPRQGLIGGIEAHLPKRYDMRFRTYAHEEFKPYYDLFYPQSVDSKVRKKRVPKNIGDLLTAKGLAYWYMDDGTTASRTTKTGIHKSYVLSTQGFCYGDQLLLTHALKRCFNLDVTIHKDKNYFRLAAVSTSSKLFHDLIKPFIVPDFYYKL